MPRKIPSKATDQIFADHSVGILIDVIDQDRCMVRVNEAQCRELGYTGDELVGRPAKAIYEPGSFDIVHRVMESMPIDGIFPLAELKLLRRSGRLLRTIATGRLRPTGAGSIELELSKLDLGPVGRRLEQMEADNRILRAILDSATEAHWMIEFIEPVDITQEPDEVIRQVFDNQSVWRMCNRAMAQLYELPDDLDLNEQSVRLYWPRSEPNEAFVRRLLESRFHLDGAVSVDRRHDRTVIVIENDVRADVRDGFLYRIWGNCRNVNVLSKTESAVRWFHALTSASTGSR